MTGDLAAAPLQFPWVETGTIRMGQDSSKKSIARLHGLRICVLLVMFDSAVSEAASEVAANDYLKLGLEELMKVNVTTVAGVPEPRFTAPAALTVISGEDIRRAGHRSIAEALRMVPGMYVARINASSYVVGARGLTGSSLTANRYLVLVDGRVVHDPLISATLWDVVDVVIEDIDRIEVIRGPGATLWGANAMNGVINVITRSAGETQGSLLSLSPGDIERIATLRHGTRFGKTAVRAFAKFADRSSFDLANGDSAHDAYSTVRAGVRADHALSARTMFTLDANLYQHPTADVSARLPVANAHLQFAQTRQPDDISGGHLLLRAQHAISTDSGFTIQAYYDQVERDTARLGVHRNTVDLDLRHWSKWGARNEFIWGAQFTQHDDRLRNTASFIFEPESRYWRRVNAFAQNTTALIDQRVFAMLGAKLTHHDFVGTEIQPGLRLWWTPSDRQTVWTALSRPVRIPSRFEEDGFIALSYVDAGLAAGMPASGTFVPLAVRGDDDLEAEHLVAYELGHRYRFGEWLALDLAAFYNDYRRLIAAPPAIFGNFVDAGMGETYGGEIAASVRPAQNWQVDAAYSYLGTTISGPVFKFDEDTTPRHLAQLRGSWQARGKLEFNAALYYVSHVDGAAIDAYERLDLGLSWDVRPGIQLAAWGQNLTDPEHPEATGVQIPRSFYAQLRLEF